MSIPTVQFATPFVVFLGDVIDPRYAKTGLGMAEWRSQECVGQIRLPGSGVCANLPDLSISDAKKAGVRSLIVGSAAIGGGIPEHWVATLRDFAEAGIDIVAGLHINLATLPGLAQAAEAGSARLIDVRVAPRNLRVGTGQRRSGKRLLTVGTDCACGKKYTALAINRAMRARNLKSDFRATGQTGIMIAGSGIPIDAVIADFVTGAAELLSPDNDIDHWDVIEGQGSIFHPAYLQVTVGLLVGSQPDAFVVCHDPLRTSVSGWPNFCLPSISEVIARTIEFGRLTNSGIRCVGVALNTSNVPLEQREALLGKFAAETNLPCVDPICDGVGLIIDQIAYDFCV